MSDINEKTSETSPEYLMALDLFNRVEYAESREKWKILLKNPEHALDYRIWFNLCTGAIMSGEIETGKDAFAHVEKILYTKEKEDRVLLIELRVYFLGALFDSGEYAEAFPVLEKLLEFYKSLAVNDRTHQVLATGNMNIPSLETVLEESIPMFKSMNRDTLMKWLDKQESELDSYGKKAIAWVRGEITI